MLQNAPPGKIRLQSAGIFTYVHGTFFDILTRWPVAGRPRSCWLAARANCIFGQTNFAEERPLGPPASCWHFFTETAVVPRASRMLGGPEGAYSSFGPTNFASTRTLADFRLADARCLPDVNAGSGWRRGMRLILLGCGILSGKGFFARIKPEAIGLEATTTNLHLRPLGAKNRARKQPGVPCGRHPDSAGDR